MTNEANTTEPNAEASGLVDLLVMRWLPIDQAPKDDTEVDLFRAHIKRKDRQRLFRYVRVDYGKDNVFYEPVNGGECVVRDATHFMIVTPPDA
jgi:hypothetical protein